MKQIKGLLEEIRGSTKHNTFKTYNDKRKVIIMSKKPIPSYTRTEEQDQQRNLFKEAVEAWNKLSSEQKQEYNEMAKPLRLTGYQLYIRQYLLNPPPTGIWYKVTIDNSSNSNNLTDYQIRIEISNDENFFSDCNNKKEAIRLFDDDKTTPLSYWIEEWDTTDHNARIWAKVPSIPASSTKIIYISVDQTRTEDESNGENTFLFFDDFDGEELDLDKWEVQGGATYSTINSILTLIGTADASKKMVAKINPLNANNPFMVDARIKLSVNESRLWAIGARSPLSISNPDQVYLTIAERWNEFYIRTTNEGNTTKVRISYTQGQTTFRIHSVGGKTNLYKAYHAYSEKGTSSNPTYQPDEDIYVQIVAPKTYDPYAELYCDWIKARKWTYPEPTTTYTKET